MYVKAKRLTASRATYIECRWNKLTEEEKAIQTPMVKPGNNYSLVRWLDKIAMSYFAEAHFLQNLARAVHMTCCEFDAPQLCKKSNYSMTIGMYLACT